MSMYNLIEYSNNYSSTSGRVWLFKRDESPIADDGIPTNVSTDNSTSFKYKLGTLGKTLFNNVNDENGKATRAKIIVQLFKKSFWRSLEMPLMNSKIHLASNQIKCCVMSTVPRATRFKITYKSVRSNNCFVK